MPDAKDGSSTVWDHPDGPLSDGSASSTSPKNSGISSVASRALENLRAAKAQAKGLTSIWNLQPAQEEKPPKPDAAAGFQRVARLTPEDDLHKIMKALPSRRLAMIVAGGVCRRHVEGYGVTDGDVDLFFSNSDALNVARLHARDNGWEKVSVSPKGSSVWVADVPGVGPVKINMIEYRFFAGPWWLVSEFDFTINQGFMVYNPTAWEIWGTADFERDVLDRVLRPVKPRSVKALLTRMQKFIRLGYYMPDESVEWVRAAVSRGALSVSKTAEDYFDPE